MGLMLAAGINATLISKGHKDYKPGRYPTFLPSLHVIDEEELTLEKFWKFTPENIHLQRYSLENNGDRNQETLELIGRSPVSWNFVYCSFREGMRGVEWDFTIFLKPFGRWVWLITITSLILISLLAFPKKTRYSSLRVILSSISVLISPGMSALPKKWDRSLLFTLWMLVCYVVVTFYSGHITSNVISPSPEMTLKSIFELEDAKYHLLMPGGSSIPNTIKYARKLAHVSHEMNLLWRIFSGNHYFIEDTYPKLIQRLASSKDKWASFTISHYAPRVAITANDLQRQKKCHVGRQLVRAGETFYAFAPPRSKKLMEVFAILVDVGIIPRWFEELTATASSSRVQDRVRILSWTKVKDDPAPVRALHMEERIITIFLLYLACIIISLLCFICEYLIYSESYKLITNVKIRPIDTLAYLLTIIKPNLFTIPVLSRRFVKIRIPSRRS